MSQYKMKLYHSMDTLTKIYIIVFVLLFTVIFAISTLMTQIHKNEKIIQDYTRILDSIYTSFEENISFHNYNTNLLFYIENRER